MTGSSTGKTAEERTAYWRGRIAEQERSGVPVQQFCKEKGITEQSFYMWRKRLRKQEPARFALVEPEPAQQHAPKTGLELILVSGERLRIGVDVNPSLLRRVLEAFVNLPPGLRQTVKTQFAVR